MLKGIYRESADDHIRVLNNWVEQHARARAVRVKGAFVSTEVAMAILQVARLIRENATMGLVVGPAGIGKTRCAQALHETYVGSILATVRRGTYHAKGFTSMLAEAFGVSAAARRGDGAYPSQLERVLGRLEGSNRLLIVDEAHKLNNDALELLREIHDATGCPVFMPATKDLQDRICRRRTISVRRALRIHSQAYADWNPHRVESRRDSRSSTSYNRRGFRHGQTLHYD